MNKNNPFTQYSTTLELLHERVAKRNEDKELSECATCGIVDTIVHPQIGCDYWKGNN